MPAMSYEERSRIMTEQYGEACTKKVAAHILGRDARTIARWIADGRIDDACAGTMVDVRSLARYLAAPKQMDLEARRRKMALKYNHEFVV